MLQKKRETEKKRFETLKVVPPSSQGLKKTFSSIGAVFQATQNQLYSLPLYQTLVSAGFPSPANDDLEDKIDLNEMLIKRPSATFFLRVSGDSMTNAGIYPNDVLIVDRSLEPTNGKVVIASVNGELTVKRLISKNNKVQLLPENENYPVLEITEEMDFRVWGVVINVIHYL